MKKTFHICNNKQTAGLIKQAGFDDLCLPWDDNLAIGPVPAVPLEKLAEHRIKYFRQVTNDKRYYDKSWIKSRNKILRQFSRFDEIVLWFDFDLGNQLQLCQLLHFFAQQTQTWARLSLVCVDHFPGVYGFRHLSELRPKQLAYLYKQRQNLEDIHLQLGHYAYRALTHKNPQSLQRVLEIKSRALPFLKDAFFRLQQEYPDKKSGLSRTEQHILRAINSGAHQPMKIFRRAVSFEDRPFLKAEEFFILVDALIDGEEGLILINKQQKLLAHGVPDDLKTLRERTLVLSALGQSVLRQQSDWLQEGAKQRWVGGVEISDQNIWRRHPEHKTITRTYV